MYLERTFQRLELNKELLRVATFTRRRHWENKKSKRISRYLYKHYSLTPHSIRWCFMAADNSQKSPVPSLTDMGRDDSTLYIQQPKNGFTKQLLSLNRLRTNPICCLYPPQAHSPISSSALLPLRGMNPFSSSSSSPSLPRNEFPFNIMLCYHQFPIDFSLPPSASIAIHIFSTHWRRKLR